MASIKLDPESGIYRVQFRYGGRQFNKSTRTAVESEADAIKGRVEETIRLIERGRITVPPDCTDLGTFILSDGKLIARPAPKPVEPPKAFTLSAMFTLYEKQFTAGAKLANTRRTERIHATHLKRLLGAETPVADIDVNQLDRYIVSRAAETVGSTDRTVQPDTIRKEIKTLRFVWAWAAERGHVAAPAWTAKKLHFASRETVRKPFRTMAEIQERIDRGGLSETDQRRLWECLYLTADEVREVLAHVQGLDVEAFVYPMFCLVALTGMRRSEALRSRIDDIDLKAKQVTVREQKRVKGRASTRRVEMHPLLETVLRKWLNPANHPGGQLTLCKPDGSPLDPDTSDNRFAVVLRGTKWAVIRGFHVFRHSFASILASKGVDQRIIDSFMGHQTKEMTERYRHLFPASKRRAIEELL